MSLLNERFIFARSPAPTEFFRHDDISQYALLRGRAGVYKTQNILMCCSTMYFDKPFY